MNLNKILEKIHNFFVRLFAGLKKYEKFVADAMPGILNILTTLLTGIQSAEVTAIEQFLPPDWQNKTEEEKKKVIDWLAKAVGKFQASNECLNKATQLELLQCFLIVFKSRSQIDQQATAAKIAALMLQAASHEDESVPTLKDSQADILAGNYFFAKKIDILEEAA